MNPTSFFSPLRASLPNRRFFAKGKLRPSDLVMPYLVTRKHADQGVIRKISLSEIGAEVRELESLGINAVKVFVQNSERSERADEAANPNNFCIDAISEFRAASKELCIHVETCLCPFTSSGSCVIMEDSGHSIAELSVQRLEELAVLQAQAGANVIGPASMLQGSVAAIHVALLKAEFQDVAIAPHLILSSGLYGPYRNASATADHEVDRRRFQIPSSETGQVIAFARAFAEEGANSILLEPGFTCSDLIPALKEATGLPIGSFSVSGEFTLLGAGPNGLSNEQLAIAAEIYTGVKRSSAEYIVTYAAKALAGWMEINN